MNTRTLSIVIVIAILLVFGWYAFYRFSDTNDSPASLSEEEKMDVLEKLSNEVASGTPSVLSDKEKRAVLESLSKATSTVGTSSPTVLSEEEKIKILESLQR